MVRVKYAYIYMAPWNLAHATSATNTIFGTLPVPHTIIPTHSLGGFATGDTNVITAPSELFGLGSR